MNLRRQFTLVFVTFAVAVSGVIGWAAWRWASGALEDQLDERLLAVAGAAIDAGGWEGIVETLRAQAYDPADGRDVYENRLAALTRWVEEAHVIDSGLVVVRSSFPHSDLVPGDTLRTAVAFTNEVAEALRTGSALTSDFSVADRPFKLAFVRVGNTPYLFVVKAPADFLEPLAFLRRGITATTVVAAFLAALLAWRLARNVVRPLERMSRAALRIQRGRLDRPVGSERGDELGRLSRAMERMRKGILERDEQLRLMLAQVAHEIRNPLSAVELFASAVQEEQDPEERVRLLSRIRAEVRALSAIIEDFLTFARPMDPSVVLGDVREPIEEAVSLVRTELDRRGGTLHVELPPGELVARADPHHVKRIMLNLLRNAAQVAKTVWLTAEERAGEIRIAVSDDGPGVALRDRARIFEPFVTDKEQGAGLGLAIVRRLAEANEGRVELAPVDEPSVGGGAEFRVYFPGAEDFPPESRARASELDDTEDESDASAPRERPSPVGTVSRSR